MDEQTDRQSPDSTFLLLFAWSFETSRYSMFLQAEFPCFFFCFFSPRIVSSSAVLLRSVHGRYSNDSFEF